MLDCIFAGDSIAVQLYQAKTECANNAVGGWNSWQFNKYRPGPMAAHTVVISLGTNDHGGVDTEAELHKVRQRIIADRVVWIVPAIKPNIQEIVRRVAGQYGDRLAIMKSLQPDRVHFDSRGVRLALDDVFGP